MNSIREYKLELKESQAKALLGDMSAQKRCAEIRDKFVDLLSGTSNAGKVLINFCEDSQSKKPTVERIDFNCRNCGANDIQNEKCQYCQTRYNLPKFQFKDLSTIRYKL